MKYKKISIYGMTCSSCEILLTDELKKISHVHDVHISRSQSFAKIFYKNSSPDVKNIALRIQELGYSTSKDTPVQKKNFPTAQEIFLALCVFFLILFLTKIFHLERFFQVSSSLSDNARFSTAFLIGIAASLSSCLAVVGAVVLSFGSQFTKSSSFKEKAWPHIRFQLGRLVGFFVLGGVLGLIGDWFQLSEYFFGIISVALATIILILGLQTIGFPISLSRLGFKPSKKFQSSWQRFRNSQNSSAPIILGILTFFLPCGFTQSMQLFALSSGSFLQGALTLFFFALGTLPVLLLLGLTSTHIQSSASKVFKIIIGLFLVLFSYFTFVSGTSILKVSAIEPSLASDFSTTSSLPANSGQSVEMHITYSGFDPSTITVKQGIPVTWTIYGDEVSGCTNEIIIPDLGIRKRIEDGKNIIQFTPQEVGTIDYSCWMGMVRGKIKVTP